LLGFDRQCVGKPPLRHRTGPGKPQNAAGNTDRDGQQTYTAPHRRQPGVSAPQHKRECCCHQPSQRRRGWQRRLLLQEPDAEHEGNGVSEHEGDAPSPDTRRQNCA
jgi:hypothetical protein